MERPGQTAPVNLKLVVGNNEPEMAKLYYMQAVYDIIKCIAEGKPLPADRERTLEEILNSINEPLRNTVMEWFSIIISFYKRQRFYNLRGNIQKVQEEVANGVDARGKSKSAIVKDFYKKTKIDKTKYDHMINIDKFFQLFRD